MENKQLKKEIHFTGALSTVMGTVIGAGVFFKTAAVAQHTLSGGLMLFSWLLAGLLTICAGLTVAELATAFPKTGGPVKYIEYVYGKLPAFLLGWAQSLIYFPANIAALSIIFATQWINLWQLPSKYLILLAVVAALSVTGLNLMGTKTAATVQSLTLVVKLIPIALIILVGVFTSGQVSVSIVNLSIGDTHTSWATGFSSALLATLFAYDGWLNVGNIAGEMKRPQRDLPRAIIIGLSLVTVIYWLINNVFLKNMPVTAIAGNLNTASEVSQILFGPIGGKVVTIGILVSVYGALNGYTMTGIRVPYALALEKNYPFHRYLSRLSKRTQVPYLAALWQVSIACAMMFLGSFDFLTDMLVFVMWLFSLLIFYAVILIRRDFPQLERPYKVPFYPWIPLIAILGGIFILVMTAITMPKLAILGIGVTLIGIPIYHMQTRVNENR